MMLLVRTPLAISCGAITAIFFLSGCVSFSADGGLEPAINVAAVTLDQHVVKVTNDAEAATAQARAEQLLKSPLKANAAVQVALLRNKNLQAAFNDLGISESQFVQASLPPAPQFSISRLAGEGDVEVIRQIVINLFDLAALPARTAVAEERFNAARWRAAGEVLTLAAEVGRQYYITVAAHDRNNFLEQSVAAAQASADLAKQLGEAGNLNKLEQAREGAFYVELGAQLADARIEAQAEREKLTRLMGLWGHEITYKLPNSLPNLPKRITKEPDVEAKALTERVDIKAGRAELAALAAQYGLTNATRFVSDVSLALEDDREWAGPAGGSATGTPPNSRLLRHGFDVAFTIPIYDFGETRVRNARETYMAAANRLAQRAIDTRSQAREAYLRYRGKYDLARYYAERVLPLRKLILDESTLRYNGMIADVTQLLIDGRARIASNIAAINARRDFFIASVDLKAALAGGSNSGSAITDSSTLTMNNGDAAN